MKLLLMKLVQFEQVAQEPAAAVAAVLLRPAEEKAVAAVVLQPVVPLVYQSRLCPRPLSLDVRSAQCYAAVLPLPDSSQ